MNIKIKKMFLKRSWIVLPMLSLVIHNNKLKIFLGIATLFIVFSVMIAKYLKEFTLKKYR